MSEGPTVAVLGTGIMGSAMARNIARAGMPVRVWDRTEEKARAVAEQSDSGEVAASPAAAVAGAGVVVTMLFDGDAVESVIRQAIDSFGPDEVWLQMSTIGLDATERLSKLAADHGVPYVDSPVLGTKQPAEQGQLTALVSGPPDAIERAQPVLDAVASKVVRLGDEPGMGTRAKLMMNHWVVSLVEATAETIAFGETLALESRLFLDIIKGGPMDSAYVQTKGKLMLERNFPPSFPLRGALKDVRLMLQAAERVDFDAALAEAIDRKMDQAVEAGHGDEDIAATYLASAR